MAKVFDAAEVAKHNTPESCWVILYGKVYDVTEFLPSHPGGKKIILKLAGKDATDEYDPVHPPGTLEENLKPENILGEVNPETLTDSQSTGENTTTQSRDNQPPPMASLMNLDEIEEEATKRISKKAWAYYFSAADDLFSKTVGLPIFVAPAAMARLAHPDGEQGIAKACSRFGAMQIVSNNASMTPEQIIEGAKPGQTFGWQLYVQNQREKSEAMLKRINSMREYYKFICLTLDAPVPGKRELDEKQNFDYSEPSPASGESKPGAGGVGQQLFFGTAADLTWKTTLPWLAAHTDLPIVLKGLQTHEDAYLAAKYAPQVKAIILSNHGGRAADTAPPAIHTLLEIRKYCPEVLSKVQIWVDGGIKRGTDVVKALCLGASGVGIGRGALFGLGAGGQAGVERTLEILEAETATCMRLLGAKSISELGPKFVNARQVERDIYDGDSGLDRQGLWTKSKL
ncbi:hypothetical protein FocTR4_00001294 [Fusarium oxysporum f. sp. cubense]|uniref:L-lactate dehydrogenase (Cytochrome) n=1 Tax=Fusarium oxysporum f. sp. cubense TaxID=61366 RepID=A0A5C6T0X9_FUSOC|nr:hypothetical protein FocTR4_00001294 [Fusarium oxysporum f. sp. cubense]